MFRDASDLARRLAREAEAVCRHYLSNGRREGRYWLVGDVHNSPGRSMFVRLQDSPKGPAGKWTDAATSEHGDLLDVIRESLGLRDFREVAEEARRFLNLPRAKPQPALKPIHPPASGGSQEAARRLFAISQPIEGTVVEAYLQHRGITRVHHGGSLRFHPRCYYRPFDDQPDPRPLPEGKMITGAVADIFDALVATLSDTRLEPDLEDLLWSTVNLFHRATDRIGRQLDDNEQAQRKSQREQNGSEVQSVELERLTAEGITLIERRNCLELFRDQAIERFEVHTGSSWRPRSGSLVNHRTLTAAMIDSREFIAAKRRAETEVMLPAGPKVALTGGLDFNDHHLIWDRLDKVHSKHPDMVLIHGGSPKGAELIASKWAINRKVPQIAFKPDWTKHAKAAPFRRNDAMLELLPIGVMHFPGTGIQDNLADKAKRLGISVWKFGAS